MYRIVKSTNQGLQEFEELSQLEKGCWLDITDPDEEEIAEILEATHVEEDFLKAALDEEEKSRIEVEDDEILVLIDIPILRSNNAYETIPLGIIITRENIITICLEDSGVTASFDDFNYKTFNTCKRTRFLLQLLYRTATLYLRYIRIMVKRSEDLENSLRDDRKDEDLLRIMDLQKSFTYFTTSLRGDAVVLDRLTRLRRLPSMAHLIEAHEEDDDYLEDVVIEFKQAIEMVEMYNNILNNMMSIFASLIGNDMNKVMKILTSITIVLAIPTWISGMWGMNVLVPFAEAEYGFWIVTAISVIISGLAGVLLWYKDMF